MILRTPGNQRLALPRISVNDGPAWDDCEVRYLCPGDPQDLGGFAHDGDFPDVSGFVIKGMEAEPVKAGLYYLTLRGQGVKAKRLVERVLPTLSTHNGSDVKVTGVPGPNPDGSWPNVEIFLPGIGFEVTYVGADSYTNSSANNPATKIGYRVQSPIQVPGFQPVSFPAAPPNPWESIRADTAKLLYAYGWVVTKAEGPALKSGLAATKHLLTIGYQYRWKVVPNG